MRVKSVAYLFLALVLISCDTTKEDDTAGSNPLAGLKADASVKYATRFSLAENDNCKALFLFGNKEIKDTSAIFIFPKKKIEFNTNAKMKVISSPCERIASLCSVYTTMLCELGVQNKILAIDNIDYYNQPVIRERFLKNEIVELSKGPQPDIERTIALQPDAILTFGMIGSSNAWEGKLNAAGIPVLVTLDHLEEGPLARAEWIKCISLFVNKKRQGDSIFSQVEKKYRELGQIANSAKEKPAVFTEVKYGEIWYVPGGKSYAANFIKDAGADYVWKDDPNSGSLQLSFEEVLSKAGEADFWLNQSLLKSKKELLAAEKRYDNFKAFKTGNLYNNIKNTNEKGYSDYWESGILHPERILSDLIQIFHPELKSQINNELYYYKKLD